jgi:hypothetical protein
MDIRIDSHTLERAAERGATTEEIKDVINSGHPIPAKYGRLGKSKIFQFSQTRLADITSRKKSKSFSLCNEML